MTAPRPCNPFEAPGPDGRRKKGSAQPGNLLPRFIEFTGFLAAVVISLIVAVVTLIGVVQVSPALFLFAILLGLAAMSISFVLVVRIFVKISEFFRIDEQFH